jgi:hypothetical protein
MEEEAIRNADNNKQRPNATLRHLDGCPNDDRKI